MGSKKVKKPVKKLEPIFVQGPVDRLPTEREQEIGQLVVDGLSNEEIGVKLAISTKTVEAHRANLYKRLHVRNTAQLITTLIASNLATIKGLKVA